MCAMSGRMGQEVRFEVISNVPVNPSDDQIREGYRQVASVYDKGCVDKIQYVAPEILINALVPLVSDWPRDSPVLDLAAGTGQVGEAVSRLLGFTAMDALDISPEMLDVARAKGLYKRLIEATVRADRRLPIEDGSYALLVCSGAFTQCLLQEDVLPEVARLVRKGGLIAFTVRCDVQEDMAGMMQRLCDEGVWELVKKLEDKYANYSNAIYCYYRKL